MPSTGATRNERQEGGRGRRRATTHHCWSSTAAPPALCVAPPAVASPRSTPGGAGAAGRARRGHGSRCAAGAGARGETAQVRHGRGRRVPRRVRRVLRAHVRLHALVAATAAQHHRAPAPPRPSTTAPAHLVQLPRAARMVTAAALHQRHRPVSIVSTTGKPSNAAMLNRAGRSRRPRRRHMCTVRRRRKRSTAMVTHWRRAAGSCRCSLRFVACWRRMNDNQGSRGSRDTAAAA